MNQILFIVGVLSFALGVGLATVYQIPISAVVWVLLLAFGVLVMQKRNGNNSATAFGCVVLLVGVALGVLRIEWHENQFGKSSLEAIVGDEVSLIGIVTREPDKRERTQQLFVKVEEDLLLVSTERYVAVEYGDRISFVGELKEPESFETDLGRTFNYPGYLRAKGVEFQISFAEVSVIEQNQGNWFLQQLLSFKRHFMDSIEASLPEPQAGLGEGLLLGVKQALGEDLEEDFRRTGIIHIVVLSGYNVMLVVAFVLYGLSFVFSKRIRVLIGLVAICCFALLVGLSATVVRASIMAGIFLIAEGLGRSYAVLRALLLAGLIMLLINPYLLLYDIGFQLSFMATLGLILALPLFETQMLKQKIIAWKELLIATIATQIAVLPLLLYHIGQVSVVSVAVNLLVLPMVPIAMLLTFITGLLGLISATLALPISFLTYYSLTYIVFIATLFGGLPFAVVEVPVIPPWLVGVLYIALGVGWWFAKRRPKQTLLQDWTIEDEVQIKNNTDRNKSVLSGEDIPKAFR